MKYHLLYQDGSYSDLADYAEKPAERLEGVWVEGEPTGPKIRDIGAVLAEMFDGQPVEIRAQLAPLRAAVKDELDLGHYDVVIAIIQGAEIPTELEPLRQAMLEKLS